MKKRLLAAALSLSLLTGCGGQALELPEAPAEAAGIAYVPLDDRPDNVGRVQYLAESLGYTLEMPERDLYRTALDGQPANGNGTQCGDRGLLYEWVLTQEENGCDRYILFLDQLLSGGLVSSRHMARHEDITLSDGTVLTEYELLDRLLTTLAADGNNQVWLLESVMRLAPTCGYDGFGLDEYNALRAYGMESRPELSSDGLGLERVLELYGKGGDGEALAAEDFGLTAETVADYCSARSRKLELTDRVFRTLGQLGNEGDPDLSDARFQVLIGIDDSSAEDSIQKNEIAYLRSLLREGDTILSGVDDLAFKAVTKLYLSESGWQGADVNVQYFGGTEDRPACDYDAQPLTEIVAEHLDYFGLTEEETPAFADLYLLVLTQPEEASQKETYIKELVRRLKELQKADLPVILMDAGNGQYGTAFHEALIKETELGGLLSYAGFLDMAIVTGTALSHGVARYAHLAAGETSQTEEAAFRKTLADSVLKDLCYKHIVREEILSYVRGELGGDPNNFWQPDIDREAVLDRLETGMEAATAKVLQNLERSAVMIGLEPHAGSTWAEWGGITLSSFTFPWDRAFEIDMTITVDPLTRLR